METGNGNGCNNSFTDDQEMFILTAMSLCAFISITICITTTVIVMCLKLHKHLVYRLTLYQVCGTLVASCSEASSCILLIHNSKWFNWQDACIAIAFFLEYGMWVKLLSTLCLVFHLFCLAVFSKDFKDFETIYIALPLLLPILFIWIPFVHNVYGPAGAWCWIKDWEDDCATEKDTFGIVEQFVLWYVPLTISLIAVIVSVFAILLVLLARGYNSRNIREDTERDVLLVNHVKEQNKKALKQLLPILAYPGIYFALCLIPIVNRLYSAVSSHTNYTLALGHSISIGLWGFFSSLGLLAHIYILKRINSNAKQHMNIQSCQSGDYRNSLSVVAYFESEEATDRFSIPTESLVDDAVARNEYVIVRSSTVTSDSPSN